LVLADQSKGATKKAFDVDSDPMELDKKVIALAARAYGSIAAPNGLCVFSIDLGVFDDGLANLSIVVSDFVDVLSPEAIDLSVFVDVISQRPIDKTHHSMD
jgi:hypothetical protein